MKEVLRRLVEIEDKAQQIMNDAANEKIPMERKKKEELESFQKNLNKQNEEKIRQLKEKVEQEIKPEMDEVYKQGNKQLMELEKNFLENGAKMAQEVFEHIK